MSFMIVKVVERIREITRFSTHLAVEARLYKLAASSCEALHNPGCP